MIRTVQLLRYLSDASIRRRVTATANKVESFNRFAQWTGFGNRRRHRRPPCSRRRGAEVVFPTPLTGTALRVAAPRPRMWPAFGQGPQITDSPGRWDIGVGRPSAHDVEWP
ncbi:Tn3 family transposase [Streptomyces sp. NPDC051000]|uniref:Tn3 family transposase n=1 Tax=unclassified Streptomyces TaxID=2593676 RepID=UPI0033D9758F